MPSSLCHRPVKKRDPSGGSRRRSTSYWCRSEAYRSGYCGTISSGDHGRYIGAGEGGFIMISKGSGRGRREGARRLRQQTQATR